LGLAAGGVSSNELSSSSSIKVTLLTTFFDCLALAGLSSFSFTIATFPFPFTLDSFPFDSFFAGAFCLLATDFALFGLGESGR
jgi:hypothetical protein